jgi:NADH-quinone oxidoreductase subunit A
MEPLTVDLSPWQPGILALVVFTFGVLGFTAVLLFLCSWLGEKRKTREKSRPYECGIIPTGFARFRFPVDFYLVALFFLIFDVETAFILSWAVAFDPLGLSGWLRISFFIIILLVSLFYIWEKGGLDWRKKGSRRPTIPKTLS